MAAWSIVEQPEAEPVAMVELREQCKVTHNREDALIKSMGVGARIHCENVLDEQFVTATWLLTLDEFPCGMFELPRPPYIGNIEIKYLDTTGVQQTLDPSKYRVDGNSLPAIVAPAHGQLWPATLCTIAAIEVTYDCGFGSPAQVPEDIKAMIRLLTAHWYANRETVVTGTIATSLPMAVDSLLAARGTGVYRYRGHDGNRELHHRGHVMFPRGAY